MSVSRILLAVVAATGGLALSVALAATTVPTDVQQPGTQPGEVSSLESVDKCDNCHGNYDLAVEPAFNWRGGMMAHAGRDAIFWATVAVAEQDFDGAGDLCIRCHSPAGWLAGRSTPTDGSGLSLTADEDGVECDVCHAMTNPDDSEHLGQQFPPFIANDGGNPAVGYYGSGQYSMSDASDKFGPYSDANARHQWEQSAFHRSPDFCGTCHDVSNPVVGDLAPNHGAQVPLAPGTFSGVPGAPVETKAAFNNFPYEYGVVERTFSEYKAGLLDDTPVSSFLTLPADLQAGALQYAYDAALVAGTGGDYEDGTLRTFSCQTCHMSPVTGKGCNKKGAAVRTDLPLHDLTGGNYWMPEVIQWLDTQGLLLLGSGLSPLDIDALNAGAQRARDNLERAASLEVLGDTVKVVNLTGHKLLSGYPEGRRMWLNTSWYDAGGSLLREDGAYGPLTVQLDGVPMLVDTILDLDGTDTRIWEAHYAMTQEWADLLVGLGWDPLMPLEFDRETGLVDETLGDLAAEAPGEHEETFHFVLNNLVESDNRIPPYGMSYDEARVRNALPVPADQFGNPGVGGTYQYWDLVPLNPPSGAVSATIDLLYQPTSWEYIQFLYLANDGSVAHLAAEGDNLLDAWIATGMAAPHTMASATWGSPICGATEAAEANCGDGLDNDCDGLFDCDDGDCAASPACAPPVCNSNGVCEAGEDCSNCASDCDGVLGGKKSSRYCCGNGVLEGPEGSGAICDGNP